jgi:hypothetical protein
MKLQRYGITKEITKEFLLKFDRRVPFEARYEITKEITRAGHLVKTWLKLYNDKYKTNP